MTDPTLLVLASLADGDKHGYAMMEDIERFAGVRLGPEQTAEFTPVASYPGLTADVRARVIAARVLAQARGLRRVGLLLSSTAWGRSSCR